MPQIPLQYLIRIKCFKCSLCTCCRNIDKAGGLDAYVFKIEGTCEDSDKAGKLRTQMGQEQERRRMQQELQAKEQQRRLARLEYDRRATLLPAAAAVIEEQTVHQN